MDVSIDPAGHDSEAAQIVIGLGGAAGDGANFGAFDHDLLILEHAALAVEDRAGLDDNTPWLSPACCQGQQSVEQFLHHLTILAGHGPAPLWPTPSSAPVAGTLQGPDRGVRRGRGRPPHLASPTLTHGV